MAQEWNIEMSQAFYMEIWNGYERSKELEEENKNLKDNVEFLHSCLDDRDKSIAIMQEENKKLKGDIKKWEDRRMVKLAEIYNIPTKYLTTAIVKNEWFSSWYDTVKKKMLHELWFDRLDVQDLLEENKNLKEENKNLRDGIEMLSWNIILW